MKLEIHARRSRENREKREKRKEKKKIRSRILMGDAFDECRNRNS